MMKTPNIFIVLPAYNAERTLTRTLAEIPAEYSQHILLVDDASQDDTVKLSKAAGIEVFSHNVNKGYGANAVNENIYTKDFMRNGWIYFEPYNKKLFTIVSQRDTYALTRVPDTAKTFIIGYYYVVPCEWINKQK